jgi:hypothetical protein
MVGGTGVCHPDDHGRGGSGRRRAEAAGEGLWVPQPEPRHLGRRLLWWRQRERGSHLLHQKAILGCRGKGVRHQLVRGSTHGRVKGRRPGGLHRKAILWCCEEGVRRRPAHGSAHGRVKGRPGGGACSGACGGASDRCGGLGVSGTRGGASGGASNGCGGSGTSGGRDSASGGANDNSSVQGPDDTRGGASRGVRVSCDEEKVGQRVASDGAHDNAYGGTNGGCSGQGASDAHDGASEGALVGCDEGRAAGAPPTATKAMVTTSMAGGVAMSKSVGQSRSGPKLVIQTPSVPSGPDLGRGEATRLDQGWARTAGSDPRPS